MRQQRSRPRRGAACRAALLSVLAVAAAALTWRLRPTTSITSGSADTAIVIGCAWLAWALAGYLAVAVAATALSHLVGAGGTVAHALSRVAPSGLRRVIDAAVTLGTAAAVIGSSSTVAAAAPPIAHVASSQLPDNPAPGSALDWPGLSKPTPTHSPRPPTHPHRHHPDLGLVGGGHVAAPPRSAAGVVVVQPGDTLWSIAARHLGPNASGAAITAAWHAWYAANRAVIGANPSLIQPGQRLHPPPGHATTER